MGGAAVVLGTVLLLVALLQPWASCPGIDDSSAGCPAGATTAVVTAAGVGAGGLGAVLLATLAVPSLGRRPHRDGDLPPAG